MKMSNRNDRLWLVALSISGAGVLLALYILLGFYAGKWIANALDGAKLWMGVGSIVGLCLGIVNIIYLVKKFMGEQNE
ncbi:ATPase F0F1 [Paenibacillus alvei]|uniref:ATPase F0F1 n=1 Tax=Paenibacillus alvei TaxID=44250 RepID=A0ABT4GS69_PAEAL|nr:AtpZ/AtpI family protein [Paenibacillus alvei]MCY9759510.1 ATPase F0F1 [Paenibacillus alvei]MCY9766306.1 ATPase F0F1 [Paenibacillus alvei]